MATLWMRVLAVHDHLAPEPVPDAEQIPKRLYYEVSTEELGRLIGLVRQASILAHEIRGIQALQCRRVQRILWSALPTGTIGPSFGIADAHPELSDPISGASIYNVHWRVFDGGIRLLADKIQSQLRPVILQGPILTLSALHDLRGRMNP